MTATDTELHQINYMALELTTQKNGLPLWWTYWPRNTWLSYLLPCSGLGTACASSLHSPSIFAHALIKLFWCQLAPHWYHHPSTIALANCHCHVFYLWDPTTRHFYLLTSLLCCKEPALPALLLACSSISFGCTPCWANATTRHLLSHIQPTSYGLIGNNRNNRWAWCSRVGR